MNERPGVTPKRYRCPSCGGPQNEVYEGDGPNGDDHIECACGVGYFGAMAPGENEQPRSYVELDL